MFLCYSADVMINSTSGTFTPEVESVCHRITVFENNVTEPNGTIFVRITNSSLKPSNTQLTTIQAEVVVVDNDSELRLNIWTSIIIHMKVYSYC